MQFSQNFFDLVRAIEGLKLTAYQDQHGVWTIGMGTVYYPDGTTVKEGDTCTYEQACQYVNAHSAGLQSHLTAVLPDTVTQGMFDAVGDFCYQEGQGAFDGSTLKKVIIADPTNFDGVEAAFNMWTKVRIDGELQVSPGVVRRRKCDFYLYQNGSNAENFFE